MTGISPELMAQIKPIFSSPLPANRVGKDWWSSSQKLNLEKFITSLIIVSPPYLAVFMIAMGVNYLVNGSPTMVNIDLYHPHYGHFSKKKFRSMEIDAHNKEWELVKKNGGLHKVKEGHDPRINKLGRILRATSVDEFPQLFNVLDESTALVGPRSFGIPEYELVLLPNMHRQPYKKYLANLADGVKVGVTGLAPTIDRHLSPEDRMTVENYWVENCTVWSDLNILARTALIPIRSNGV